MRLPSQLSALAEPRFRLLWLGQAASSFGDSLVPVALAFAVVRLTGSRTDLGLVLMAGMIPRAGLMLVGGVWADRLPRQRVMLAADLLRCVTQALLAALLLTGSAAVWHLAVLAAVYGAGTAFFAPAATGLVPATVPETRLQEANALMSLARSGFWAIGPAVAGGIVGVASPGWAFAVDAGSFAVSAASLAALRVGARPAVRRRAFLRELREGWQELRSRTWLWASVVAFAGGNAGLAAIFVLGPFVAVDAFDGASSWGVIATCAGAGSLAGDALALRVRPPRPLVAVAVAFSLGTVELALLAIPAPLALVCVSAVAAFAGIAFGNAVWQTTLQRNVPAEALSRVSAYDWMGSLVVQPLAFAAVGPVAAAAGTAWTLAGSAGLVALAAAAILAPPSARALATRA